MKIKNFKSVTEGALSDISNDKDLQCPGLWAKLLNTKKQRRLNAELGMRAINHYNNDNYKKVVKLINS